ncbi:MAG: heme o synthase [Roseiflexus sp.]|nr:heme o synthase [Roseiflexus sp.]
MRRENARAVALPLFRSSWMFIPLALVAYGAILAGSIVPDVTGAAVSGIATAALGAALALYTGMRASAAPVRLGGRAAAARRSYLTLAFGAVGVLYLAVIAGALNTSAGTLWTCQTWPGCDGSGAGAWLALAHRGLAGVATLLIAALAVQTWRIKHERALRIAVAWALGLMLTQNIVGLVQVILAQAGESLPVSVARLMHLGLSATAWGALVVLATLALRRPFPSVMPAKAPSSATVARSGMTDTVLLEGKPSLLKDYISLTKPGVISLLILTTITSMYITPAGIPELSLVIWTTIGGWLMASGSHSINCYLDKDIDINMGRTSRRPIPSGRIPAWHALALGIALGVIAFAILTIFVNLLAALLALAGFLYYVFIYTIWLKRTSKHNIVIGGGAGAFPPLVGWAAATGSLAPEALILWLIVFFWTPPHFWALALIREKDYARAGVPMLPVVAGDVETRRQIVLYTIAMLALTALPSLLGMLGWSYLMMAAVFGGLFLHYALKLRRDGTTATAWALYKYSLLYLALLFVAMVVDRTAFA